MVQRKDRGSAGRTAQLMARIVQSQSEGLHSGARFPWGSRLRRVDLGTSTLRAVETPPRLVRRSHAERFHCDEVWQDSSCRSVCFDSHSGLLNIAAARMKVKGSSA
jgi:hypothetical protein